MMHSVVRALIAVMVTIVTVLAWLSVKVHVQAGGKNGFVLDMIVDGPYYYCRQEQWKQEQQAVLPE